jgi:tRNA(Ile)-lysidine synthase
MTKSAFASPIGFATPAALAGVAPDTPVLLALSGGADSRALLELLAEASKRDGFRLLLAHVNHGIRGEDAIRDREFCRTLAEHYGMEIALLDVNVPALAAERGQGIEETAREVRYEFFERLMRERGIPLLATAHHADDNLETLLFRICRGSGLRGLSAIAPCRPFGIGSLVRPLLRVSRREIEMLCEARGLEFVTDVTNADTAYARNRIRAEVIPILETLFDAPQGRVAEMTEGLRADEAYLSSVAEDFYEKHLTNGTLPRDPLASLASPIRSRVLRLWVEHEIGVEPERVHLQALDGLLLATEQTASEVALPCDHVALCEFGALRILPRDGSREADYRIPLALGSVRPCGEEIEITVTRTDAPRKIHNLYTQTCIISHTRFDIIKDGAHWRPYREGDRILRGGMHKRLRRCWNEAKIPTRLRGILPILCDSEGVLWAPYVGLRDGIPVNETNDLLEICVTVRGELRDRRELERKK